MQSRSLSTKNPWGHLLGRTAAMGKPYPLGNKNYASDEGKIFDIVKLIPTGWQYPEDPCVQIILEGLEYKIDNFKETPWRQTSEILVNGELKGILTVSYLQGKPVKDEGPFYMEERTLINVIAKFLGEMIELE